MAYEEMLSLDRQIRGEKSEQKYIDTGVPLAYFQLSRMARDMRCGKTDGRFSASIHGVESTISYRSITSMPGWYVIVGLANKDVSDITQQFSLLGGIFGSILVGITLIYMLSILLLEKKDKKIYNDTYGHNNGDLCLKHCAHIMKKNFPLCLPLGR